MVVRGWESTIYPFSKTNFLRLPEEFILLGVNKDRYCVRIRQLHTSIHACLHSGVFERLTWKMSRFVIERSLTFIPKLYAKKWFQHINYKFMSVCLSVDTLNRQKRCLLGVLLNFEHSILPAAKQTHTHDINTDLPVTTLKRKWNKRIISQQMRVTHCIGGELRRLKWIILFNIYGGNIYSVLRHWALFNELCIKYKGKIWIVIVFFFSCDYDYASWS